MSRLTASQLRAHVEGARSESNYFTRETMRFFGDTMRNYGCRGPLPFVTNSGECIQVYELYRRRPVKHGNQAPAYFRADTYARAFGNLIHNQE